MNKIVYIFLIFFCPFTLGITAQTTNLIATERIGLGEFNFSNSTITDAMGGLSTIYQSPFGTELNFYNPAANTNLENTAFEVNGFYRYNSQDISNKNYSNSNFNFNRFSLGFPILNKINFGIGYKQFTNANQDTSNTRTFVSNGLSFDSADSHSITKINTINGGLNKLQSFVSYKASKNFFLGLSIDYLSGTITNSNNEIISRKVEDPNEIRIVNSTINNVPTPIKYNVRTNIEKDQLESVTIKNLNFTIGALQKIELKKNSFVLLGATFGTGSNTDEVNTSSSKVITDYYLTQIDGGSSTLVNKTTQYPLLTGLDNNTATPTDNKFKLTLKPLNKFSFSTGLEKKEKYMIGAEFQFDGTGIFGDMYKSSGLDLTYQNRYRISTGGWWLPNKNNSKNYFERIVYRGGLYFEQTPVKLNGKSINDFSIAFGSGLPIGKNTLSTINLGIEYINRGSSFNFSNNINSVLFKFGINFSGKWFAKRLID